MAKFVYKPHFEEEPKKKITAQPKASTSKTISRPQPKKEPGLLSGLFDILSRGNYASANSMLARRKELKTQREEAVSKAKNPIDKAFAQMKVPKYSMEPTKAFFRGLRGEEKPTYDDVLAKEGVKKGLPRALAGLMGDIALDPTNLINPAGAVSKAGKAIAKVSPGTASKVAKVGEAVRSTAPIQLLGKGFIPNFRPAGVEKNVWNTYVDLKKGYEVGLDSAQHKLVDDVIGMAKGTSKKQRQALTDALETGAPLDEAGQKFRGKFDEIQQALEQRGLLKNKRENYVTHIKRDKERKLLGRLTKPLRPYNPYNRQRTIEGTVKEINERTGKQFFEDDIARILGESGLTSTRAIKTHDFVNDVVEKLGKKVKATDKVADGHSLYMPKGNLKFYPELLAPEGQVAKQIAEGRNLIEIPAEELKKGIGVSKNVEAYSLPHAVAEELNNYTKFDNSTVDKVLRKYDKYVMNPWKALATAANPGFHVRNAISNQWQNYLDLGGKVLNPVAQWKAVKPFLNDKTIKVGDKTYKSEELLNLMKENGILNQGWIAKDVPEYIEGELRHGLAKAPGKALNLINPFSQKFIGRKVGNAVENQSAAFNFIHNLEKSGDVKNAAAHRDKFLFDYGDLTDFEKKVMRRTIPFYTWMRKNIPLQAEQLAKQPGKYAVIPKATRAIESQSNPVDETWLPDYMKGQIRTPFGTSNKPIYWNPNMPYQDLEKLNPADFGKNLISSLNPILKAGVELGANKNFFFNDEIEKKRYNYDTNQIETVNVKPPAYLMALPDEYKERLGMVQEKNFEGELEWKMSPKTRYFLQQVPFLENATKGIDKEGTDKKLHYLSWLGGIKGSVYDVDKQMSYAMSDKAKEQGMSQTMLNEMVKTLGDYGVDKKTAYDITLNTQSNKLVREYPSGGKALENFKNTFNLLAKKGVPPKNAYQLLLNNKPLNSYKTASGTTQETTLNTLVKLGMKPTDAYQMIVKEYPLTDLQTRTLVELVNRGNSPVDAYNMIMAKRDRDRAKRETPKAPPTEKKKRQQLSWALKNLNK